MDWAKHRRRKAAAKCHMRLDLQSLLPRFAIIDTAKENDAKRARELCGGLRAGEIVLFDKAYVDFSHLHEMTQRGVYFVSRAKDNLAYRCVKRLQKKPQGKILRDDLIVLKTPASRQDYPLRLRRVEALVEVKGKEVVMVFLTNNLTGAPSSVCELYRCRWSIETFFREIKQTLNLCDFLGHSANAVRWQVWTALLLYVLMRFQLRLSKPLGTQFHALVYDGAGGGMGSLRCARLTGFLWDSSADVFECALPRNRLIYRVLGSFLWDSK